MAVLGLRPALLPKLEGAAPGWAGVIRNRTGVHGRGEPPRDPAAAWTWRQLNDELDRRAGVSLEALQTKSEKLREQLRRVTVGLIDKRAWSAQARRTSSRQRQALVGWLDTIRRIGKGHGIRVSLLRAEAARKMSECRSAVPVWVMPLSRVVDNFRCVPEIIQFSNLISYDYRTKPLRDASRVHLRPHTIAYRVSGSSRDGKINRQEALATASLLAAAIEQPEYKKNDAGQPTSFGVVSLVGDEQAIEIDNLLRSHLSPDRYELHRFLCGNAAQFQGDERDVIFISLVDTAQRGPLSLRDQELFKQRFNVAASRARDQMWIVHSLSPHNDLNADDLRRLLIEHSPDPTRLMRALDEKEQRMQSAFEREVMKRLSAAGCRVAPQWRVGAFRIDLVVEGDGRRLAIECDGDRYHPLEKLPEDMDRQSVLERMGWIFTRIRGTEFLRNPDRAMKSVFEKLQLLQIFPNAGPPHPTEHPP